ncbi:solute carrier family 35 member F4 isoform X2 [Panthera onca]|uniref:Solute carrier family 35 member F4 isoform X2 n=1 Tax=Acinonyx jubatus TaxID=32536 RepID=A0ABM3Q958_ACIJB|nr:solute carrier family 35 member F4 isoform X2 [Felis catus]XP_053080459.1 solute carrier family 35 member F4 isoform X2 [Acinonyx jubatus]
MDVKAAPNGVATIEDRILRITGYYGYYPGYSSQKSTSRSSVTRCKPGANCPSSHSGISRQLSPLSVTEDSSAPILELQSRGSSGVCGHRVERQNRSGDDGTQTHPENSSQENRIKARCRSCTSMVLKAVWGLLIILSVSSSWVGTTQIVKITYKNFYCPFFMTWFSTNWNIMFFPVYYSGHLATAQEKQSPMKKFRECSRIFGEDGLTLKLFLKRTAPFSILWTLTNYLYLLALKKLTATDVSALFCCNKAFVFLLSWIVLKDRFMGVRIVAAIMAITGIVMMAYADNFHTDSIIGVAFAVGSASTSALYKVEHWSSFAALPWGYLCGMAGLWLAFNILVNVGVVLTYPILISIGTVLSVPGNAAVDLLKQEVIFNVVRLAATIIICIGFLLMLLPEEWDEITLRFINSLKEKKSEEHVDDITDSNVHLRSRSRANGTVSIPLA